MHLLRSTSGPAPAPADVEMRDGERGAVAVVVALFMLIFIALLAFVVDFGRVYVAQAQVQNAADSAALAAAIDLPVATGCSGQPPSSGTSACKIAGDYVTRNGLARTAATVTSTSGSSTIAVEVTTEVPFTFGRVMGVSSRTVTGRAVATKSTTGGAGGYTIFTERNLSVNGNFTVTGSVYAGGSVDLGGSTSISSGLVAGAWGPGRNVTGANRVAGSVWAYGTILPTGDTRYPLQTSGSAPVEQITVTEYALETVHLQERLDADALLTSPARRTMSTGTCAPLASTVYLECTGSSMSINLRNISASAFPLLRTVKVARFTGTGTNIVGTWTDPPGPILLWATSTSTTAFDLQGNGTVNGYLYAPEGGFSSTGGRQIDGRIMTKLTVSGAGNPNPTNANAYENSNFGSNGVALTE